MHVSFDRCDQETPGGVAALGDLQCLIVRHPRILDLNRFDISGKIFRLLGFHVGEKPSDRFLHHAGGFHHLRQKHFSRTEQIPDHAHAVHQRTFDHFQRPAVFHPSLFGILINEAINPLQQGILQTLLHTVLTP